MKRLIQLSEIAATGEAAGLVCLYHGRGRNEGVAAGKRRVCYEFGVAKGGEWGEVGRGRLVAGRWSLAGGLRAGLAGARLPRGGESPPHGPHLVSGCSRGKDSP